MAIPKYCILCENYKQHPCRCTHCEDFDEFIVSESGKHLILTMNKQYEKEKIVEELKKIKEKLDFHFPKENSNIPNLTQFIDMQNYINYIIDKQIEELKGEK